MTNSANFWLLKHLQLWCPWSQVIYFEYKPVLQTCVTPRRNIQLPIMSCCPLQMSDSLSRNWKLKTEIELKLKFFVLQRLDSLSRAPVFSHFSDTLTGLVTIRSFRCTSILCADTILYVGESQLFAWILTSWYFRVQPKFINALCEKIDTNTSAFLILQVKLGLLFLGF